jgi:ABC-2 type transport system permease protein
MTVEAHTGTTHKTRWPRRPARHLVNNPVVLKELRGRMRGARAFTVLSIYLTLLGAFSSLIYVAVAESSMNVSGQVVVGEIGRTLFGGVVAIEMLLVAFIAPAFTAGAISGEREHQTLELLKTTLLPAPSFVAGKLLAAMLYVLLLLCAAIPLQSIAFFFGGVAETEVALSFVLLAITALLFTTIGVFFSARSRRTLSSSVLTYGATAFIMFGLPILLGAIMLIAGFSMSSVGSSPVEVAMLVFTGIVLSTNPAAVALITQYLLISRQTLTTFEFTLNNGDTVTLISPWIPFVIIYLALTAVFFALAVRRMRRVEE